MRHSQKEKQNRRLRSAQIIPLGFLLLIAVGTGLLLLPVATVPGRDTSFLTALFSATTSVCVTGLVVVDTAAHWTLFGKIVILILIQLGGLGVIVVSASVLLLLHRSFSIKERVLLRDSFNLDSIAGLGRFLGGVVRGVFLVEGVGALLYAVSFVPRYGWGRGLWYSVFHAVSAFCNAGIDLLGADSLLSLQGDAWALCVTMALIVIGGLGYIVWFEFVSAGRKLLSRGRTGRIGEHTRLVLLLTAGLIALGAAAILLLEGKNPHALGAMSPGQRVLHSLFQSVTFRTAGFSTIPQSGLTEASVLLGCILMLIGGSPMGTAGGVKTVTVFVLFQEALSHVNNRRDATTFSRRIEPDLIKKATAIVLASLSLTLLMSVLLIAIERLPLSDGLYEVCSATATVGLSRGITPTLSGAGRVILIAGMYLGRIGPISLALFFGAKEQDRNEVRCADGRFFVG